MTSPKITLRILATTDLHMNLTGFDYAGDAQGTGAGLIGLASLIAKARKESAAMPCLLVDNGDFLQGSPLADWLSTKTGMSDHPLVSIFNALEYDAIGLGNHDLDYPAAYLEAFIAAVNAPVLSTNLVASGIRGLHPTRLLERRVTTEHGVRALKIRIVSALPPETAIWNRINMPAGAILKDPQDSLRVAVQDLRTQGADLVIALAHMGLHDPQTTPIGTDATSGARGIAQIPGIDAMISGHTHHRYPENPSKKDETIGCPAVMPGFAASDLGVLDLALICDTNGGWQVAGHKADLWPHPATATPDPCLSALAAPAHHAARRALAEPVGKAKHRLHSYFALLHPANTMAIAARAKALAIRGCLRGTAYETLPLLATAAARAVGGGGEANAYIDIAEGPLLRRDLAGFSPFANRICAMVLPGAALRTWLEKSASVYTTLSPQADHQMLLNAQIPTFVFDAICGLTYQIDPTRPLGTRISEICYGGLPVQDTQPFVLATNTFRAAGGGGYAEIGLPAPIAHSDMSPTESIRAALETDAFADWGGILPWHLKRTGTKACFDTSPKAIAHLNEIRHFAPRNMGETDRGYLRLEITL